MRETKNEVLMVETDLAENTPLQHKELFDYAGLLNRMDNDEEIVLVVLDAFLQDVPPRIEAQQRAIESKDFQQIVETAHSIKGTAANISANSLSHYALIIEQAAKQRDIATVVKTYPAVQKVFIQLQAVLEKLLA